MRPGHMERTRAIRTWRSRRTGIESLSRVIRRHPERLSRTTSCCALLKSPALRVMKASYSTLAIRERILRFPRRRDLTIHTTGTAAATVEEVVLRLEVASDSDVEDIAVPLDMEGVSLTIPIWISSPGRIF